MSDLFTYIRRHKDTQTCALKYADSEAVIEKDAIGVSSALLCRTCSTIQFGFVCKLKKDILFTFTGLCIFILGLDSLFKKCFIYLVLAGLPPVSLSPPPS